MKKTVCDRCGAEITGRSNTMNVTGPFEVPADRYVLQHFEGLYSRDLDLCRDCTKDFKTFLENEPVVKHCKDCKYYDGATMCSKHRAVMVKNDYCSCWVEDEEKKAKNEDAEVKVLWGGNCLACGKPLETGRLFVCQECDEKNRKRLRWMKDEDAEV